MAVCLCVLVCAGLPAPASAATPPRGFFGLGGWSYPDDAQADALGAAGLQIFRGALAWGDIQPSATASTNWANPDALATRASRNGFSILFDLNGCAPWACGAVNRPPSGANLPAYRAFVAEAVNRYRPGGAFWAANPRLTPVPVSWQVWNEVNGGHFWPDATAADYAAFLAAISQTIKAADRAALVVQSGLVEKPGDSHGSFLAEFLSDLYAQPGYRASFDVAAVHGYAEDPAGTVRILDTYRRVMVTHGDADRPLWITEMSWASGGPAHPFTKDEPTQAAHLRRSWDTLLGCRTRWNLERAMWFALQDFNGAVFGEADYWGFNNGLLRRDGSRKPAYDEARAYFADAPLPDGRGEGCGLPNGTVLDVTDPDTRIAATPGVTRDTAGAKVSFGSPDEATEGGITYECSVDSSDWRRCTSPLPVPSRREGDHEIRVRAFDRQGNVDPTPARGTWLLDLSPPNTTLTSRTPRWSGNRVLKVGFAATDAVAVAGHECRLDAGPWKACKSPYATARLKPGKHSIAVRAFDTAGNVDPTPLNPTFKIDPRRPVLGQQRLVAAPKCSAKKRTVTKRAVKKRSVTKKRATAKTAAAKCKRASKRKSRAKRQL